jgi:hypothetical protein
MGTDSVAANAHRFAPAAPDEEYVYGACAPGWHSAASHTVALEDWIAFMKERDIERVCCLLAGQPGAGDGDLPRYRAAFGDENVCHAPTADAHLVDVETLASDILPFLEASREREQKVVVHGLAGIGRTGQVLATWLAAYRGYEPRDAVDTVREMGRDPREAIHRGNASLADLRSVLRQVG